MRKHTKRKHWPTGHMLLPHQRDRIIMPVHVSMAAIEMGGGGIENRHTLAAFLNIAGVCSIRMSGVAQETRDALDAAKRALVEVDKRYLKTGRWGFSGEQMLVMREAISIGDELIKRVNSATLAYAVEFVGSINDKTPEVLGYHDAPLGAAA